MMLNAASKLTVLSYFKLLIVSSLILNSGCVVVPTVDNTHTKRCEISSDHKTLKVVDLADETNSFYSISGLVLYPITAIASGTYVAVNNVYHYGEEKIVCSSPKETIRCRPDEAITCTSTPIDEGSDT